MVELCDQLGIVKCFREILENSHLATVMLDCDGHIIYANPYLLKLTEWTLGEVLDKSWFEVFIPEHHQQMKVILNTRTNNQTQPMMPKYESEVRTKSGKTIWIEWNNHYLRDNENKIVGSVSIGPNTTKNHKKEAKNVIDVPYKITSWVLPFQHLSEDQESLIKKRKNSI